VIGLDLPDEWVFRLLIDTIGLLIVVTLLLAAVAIRLRRRNSRRAAHFDALEAEWTPLLGAVLYEGADPARLHERVSASDAEHFMVFVNRYAERVRGAELQQLQGLAAPYVGGLVRRVGRGSPESRAQRVRLIADLGMPEHTDVVLESLDDPSPLVAMIAARRLFRPGNEQHFDAVLARLDRFGEWSRRFLAGMLAAGGPAVAPALVRMLTDRGRSEEDRAVAAEALTLLHEIDAASLAARELETAETRSLGVALLRLLQAVGGPREADAVRARMSALDPIVRQAAVETLGALGDMGDAERIVGRLEDPSPWVRMRAASALETLGAREALLRAAEGDGAGSVAAAEVLSA